MTAALDRTALFLLLGVGLCGTFGQVLLTKAFASGPPARVSVLSLTQVVFGLGYDLILQTRQLTLYDAAGIRDGACSDRLDHGSGGSTAGTGPPDATTPASASDPWRPETENGRAVHLSTQPGIRTGLARRATTQPRPRGAGNRARLPTPISASTPTSSTSTGWPSGFASDADPARPRTRRFARSTGCCSSRKATPGTKKTTSIPATAISMR